MRITQSMTNRRYLTQLNAALERKNSSERKINSTKRYNRASEDPISAAKALRVRKAISDTEDYLNNLETAEQIYNAADSALFNIVDILDSIVEKVTYAANGTQHDEDEEILAQTVETFADEIVRTLNVDSAERKIFGGVNNSDSIFKIVTGADGSKTVTYNGVDVNSLQNSDEFPYAEVSYTDIGTGMTVDPATGRVDPQSALPVTLNGAWVTGCGVDEEGDSRNVIQLTLSAAQAVREGDKIKAMDYIDKLREAQTNVSIAHADIGNKQEYIEYNQQRLTTNMENLLEKQNSLEGTDMGAESTNWKTLEAIYNVSLQMATSVLPMSIFDFIS